MNLTNLRVEAATAFQRSMIGINGHFLMQIDMNGTSTVIVGYKDMPTNEQAIKDFNIWLAGFRSAVSEIGNTLSTSLDSGTTRGIATGILNGISTVKFKVPVPHDAPKTTTTHTKPDSGAEPESPIKFRKGRSHE
jgi:hypothetical protein